LFCSLLYGASALLSIPVGVVRAKISTEHTKGGMATSLRYLRLRPLAWTAIWAVSLHCALTMGYQGMLPAFVSTDLGGGDAAYGVLLASIGLGAVIGSIGLAMVTAANFRSGLFVVSLVASGVSLSLMGAAQSVPLAVASGFFVGASQAMFMSMALALIQGSVEDEFRGRATSLYQMITGAPMAIFGWGMGGLADITEPRPLMVVSGLTFVVVIAACALASSWLRMLFRPVAWANKDAALASSAAS
jgi:MFS family permease